MDICGRRGCNREATDGYKTCEHCREQQRKAQQRYRDKEQPDLPSGICSKCRRRPTESTYKQCVQCRAEMREYQHRWAARNPEKIAIQNARAKWRYRYDPEFRARAIAASARYAREHKSAVRTNRLAFRLPDLAGFDFERMWQAQNGLCAICGDALRKEGRGGVNVDHCHESGKVRDLLCSACNNGLGCFKDEPVRLRKAISYLLRHREKVDSS